MAFAAPTDIDQLFTLGRTYQFPKGQLL